MQHEADHVLSQFQQGDLDAFEALFRMHQRAVYGWILRIVPGVVNHSGSGDYRQEF